MCRQGASSLSNGDTAGSAGPGALGEAPYANLTQLHKAQLGGGGNFSIQNETEFPALPGTSEQRGSEEGQQTAAGQQPPPQQQQVPVPAAALQRPFVPEYGRGAVTMVAVLHTLAVLSYPCCVILVCIPLENQECHAH